MTMRIPLTRPSPVRLSEATDKLREIEDRSIFSNFGPVSDAFEENIIRELFGGEGECLTLCNATTGLLIAMREVVERHGGGRRRYALMPSFTFAAAAQAAKWNRLTPLFCDINAVDWSADRASEQRLLEKYHQEIAVVVPYATFGYAIDLEWYEEIQRRYGIPVVVDAAASLGTVSEDGRGFGTGFSGAVIYSIHVTKPFSTAEGGLVYSADPELIQTLRSMSNFGFTEPRNATRMGLNGKMSEVSALLAHLRLQDFDAVMDRRTQLIRLYRDLLPELFYQPEQSHRQAHQFTSTLLPPQMAEHRTAIRTEMGQRGISSTTYFSPHVAEQGYFRGDADLASLPVTNGIASRVLTLPLYDAMTEEEVEQVAVAVQAALAEHTPLLAR